MAALRLESPLISKSGLSGVASGKFEIGKEVQRGVLSDRFNFFACLICLFFIAVQSGLLALYFRMLPPEIPLFYSNTWGNPLLAGRIFIWLLPTLGFFFILANFSILIFFTGEQKFLARVLAVASLVVGFCTFYAVVKIVTLMA